MDELDRWARVGALCTEGVGTAVVTGWAGLIGDLSGAGWGLAVLIGSGLCVVAFGLGVVFSHTAVDDRALDLLAGGESPAEHPLLDRRAQRLTSMRERREIANGLRSLALESRAPTGPFIARPPVWNRHTVATVAPQLIRSADALADGPARLRALALADRLLRDASVSPLYGPDVDAARREVGRIVFLVDQQEKTLRRPHERSVRMRP